jgi:FAD-dependent oxidoreductase domain-containing protein 1
MTPSVGIVGGGVMGLATACFLAREHGLRVTVFERDPSYARASSALSASSIRVQFSQPVNVRLSMQSFAMFARLDQLLGLPSDAVQIGLVERGYLYLATAAGEPVLRSNHALQTREGASVRLMTPAQLAERWPALRTDDLSVASLGLQGEGWFDAWSLLQVYRRAALQAGVQIRTEAIHSLVVEHGRAAGWRLADTRVARFDLALLAAGGWSAELLRPLSIELPIRARKRDVFVFDAAPVMSDGPLLIDPSGLWFRPEGATSADGRTQRYLCGAPPRGEDADDLPLDAIDHGLFDEVLWPALAHRVPAFEALRQRHAWAGYYEMNTADHNALVGPWPGIEGLHLCCGFSGHGIQQSPAVGQQLARRIATGAWAEPLLAQLEPVRWLRGEALLEANVI